MVAQDFTVDLSKPLVFQVKSHFLFSVFLLICKIYVSGMYYDILACLLHSSEIKSMGGTPIPFITLVYLGLGIKT